MLTFYQCLTALSQTILKKKQVNSVIQAVSRWRNVAELLNTAEARQKVECVEAELERLMEELGAQVTPRKKSVKATASK